MKEIFEVLWYRSLSLIMNMPLEKVERVTKNIEI